MICLLINGLFLLQLLKNRKSLFLKNQYFSNSTRIGFPSLKYRWRYLSPTLKTTQPVLLPQNDYTQYDQLYAILLCYTTLIIIVYVLFYEFCFIGLVLDILFLSNM